MRPKLRYTTPLSQCSYLPDQQWRLDYVYFDELSPADYLRLLNAGWRRSGMSVFRPRCPSCSACQSLRLPVARFRPSRSQRRCASMNRGVVSLSVGFAEPSPEKLALYLAHHRHHARAKGWPDPTSDRAISHLSAFSACPYPVEEWLYRLGERLVAVSYIDPLPDGLSGVYFFLDPDEHRRSLGTWIVLTMIERARELGLPYVYLGYFVEGCRSLAYKARFTPNQILGNDGQWRDFRP